jgi:hypothetical protein
MLPLPLPFFFPLSDISFLPILLKFLKIIFLKILTVWVEKIYQKEEKRKVKVKVAFYMGGESIIEKIKVL